MIYIFYGQDRRRSEEKWRAAQVALKTRRPDVTIFAVSSDTFDPVRFEEWAISTTLFDQKFVVTGNGLLENDRVVECLRPLIPSLQSSPNIFLLWESELPTGWVEILAAVGAPIQEFSLLKPVRPFNIFSLTDAVGARDRKQAWLLYQAAGRSGLRPEEIFWKLVWQVKNLLLVKTMGERPIKSLKPFVLDKSRSAARNFSLEELTELSRKLVCLYHEAHRGQTDLALALEHFILDL